MSEEPTAREDDELTTTIRLLVAEIDQGLGLDRWVFVRRWSVLSKAYAGAALRHCSILLEEMDHARRVGRETTVRILLRTHLETWLVGMYLVFGDDEALDAIAADYLSTMEKWERQLTAYNDKTQRAIEDAERRNVKIHADNDGKARWNRLHPDQPPRPIISEVSVPTRKPVEFVLAPALLGAQTDVPAREMILSNVAARLTSSSMRWLMTLQEKPRT